MVSVIRSFSLRLFCPFLMSISFTACGTSGATPLAPQPTPHNVASVQVIHSNGPPEKQVISTLSVTQNNCGGTGILPNDFGRSHIIKYDMEVGGSVTVSAEGGVDIAGAGKIQVGAEVAGSYSVSYGEERTLSRSITLLTDADEHTEHNIQEIEYWQTGEVVIVINGKVVERFPYKFRTDFNVERTGGMDLGCPTTSVNTQVPSLAPVTPTAAPIAPPLPTVAPIASPLPTAIPPSPKPLSGDIPFGLSDSPYTLNTVFGWRQGVSPKSYYDLRDGPNKIRLVTGPNTDQWVDRDTAPLLVLPFEGDFITQVKVFIDPQKNFQRAGLGVRSTPDNNTWINIGRQYSRGDAVQGYVRQQGISSGLQFTGYQNDAIYLRIERSGNRFTLSYSEDGSIWTNLEKDYPVEMAQEVQVYVFVLSTVIDEEVSAEFSDFKIIDK